MNEAIKTPENNIENIDLKEGQESNIDKNINKIIENIKIDPKYKKNIKQILEKTQDKNKEFNNEELIKFGEAFQNMYTAINNKGSKPLFILQKTQFTKIGILRNYIKDFSDNNGINKENQNIYLKTEELKQKGKTNNLSQKEEIKTPRKNQIKKVETFINKYTINYNFPENRKNNIKQGTEKAIKKELNEIYNENLSPQQINEKVQTILKAQIIAQQIADKMANPPAGYTPSVEEIKFLENINKLNQSLGIDEITQNEKPGKSAHIKSLESINEDSNNNFSAEFKETNTDIKNDYIEDKNVTVMNKESLKETIGNSMNDSIIEKIGIIKTPEIKEEISSILNQVSSKNPNAKLNPKDIMDNYFDNISFNNDGDLQIKESDSPNLNTLFGKINGLIKNKYFGQNKVEEFKDSKIFPTVNEVCKEKMISAAIQGTTQYFSGFIGKTDFDAETILNMKDNISFDADKKIVELTIKNKGQEIKITYDAINGKYQISDLIGRNKTTDSEAREKNNSEDKKFDLMNLEKGETLPINGQKREKDIKTAAIKEVTNKLPNTFKKTKYENPNQFKKAFTENLSKNVGSITENTRTSNFDYNQSVFKRAIAKNTLITPVISMLKKYNIIKKNNTVEKDESGAYDILTTIDNFSDYGTTTEMETFKNSLEEFEEVASMLKGTPKNTNNIRYRKLGNDPKNTEISKTQIFSQIFQGCKNMEGGQLQKSSLNPELFQYTLKQIKNSLNGNFEETIRPKFYTAYTKLKGDLVTEEEHANAGPTLDKNLQGVPYNLLQQNNTTLK